MPLFGTVSLGIAGDLVASYLKRRAGVKDYGDILGTSTALLQCTMTAISMHTPV